MVKCWLFIFCFDNKLGYLFLHHTLRVCVLWKHDDYYEKLRPHTLCIRSFATQLPCQDASEYGKTVKSDRFESRDEKYIMHFNGLWMNCCDFVSQKIHNYSAVCLSFSFDFGFANKAMKKTLFNSILSIDRWENT